MLADPHPFLVHFPVAWLPIAAGWAVWDAARSTAGPARGLPAPVRPGGLDAALLLTALAAIVASSTGDAALSGHQLEGDTALRLAERHELFGGWCAWLAGLALAGRAFLLLQSRPQAGRRKVSAESVGEFGREAAGKSAGSTRTVNVLRWVVASIVVASSLAALGAGYYGGRLVHEESVTAAGPTRVATQDDSPDVYRAR